VRGFFYVSMHLTPYLTHERTLVCAIDSHLSKMVHTRPFITAGRRDILEAFSEFWLDQRGGANDIAAIDSESILHFIRSSENPNQTAEALTAFFFWARDEQLLPQ
jgi:hypothetical protein